MADENTPVGALDVLAAAAADEPSTMTQAFGAAVVDRLRDLVDARREHVRAETFGGPRDEEPELPLEDEGSEYDHEDDAFDHEEE